MKAKLLQR